jgi:uncharacterized protein YjdB
MRKFYSRILAVCMAGTMALTPFTPVGTLIGNTITIEAKAAEASVDTSWYENGQTEFTISTEAQLRGLAELVNKQIKLFSGCTVKLANDIVMDDSESFTPIGLNRNRGFGGIFDGQNHTIKNMFIYNEINNENLTGLYVGLFGSAIGKNSTTTTIKNLTVENATVIEKCDESTTIKNVNQSTQGTAALVGYGKNIYIENCSVKDSNVSNDVLRTTGGLVGNLNGGSISECKVINTKVNGILSEGLLSGVIDTVGNPKTGPIVVDNAVKDVYVQGNVKGQDGSKFTGGLVGNSVDSNISNAIVGKDSIIEGDSNVAGIVGENRGDIKNCFNSAKIVGKEYVAGIATGIGTELVKIENCYNLGEVDAKDNTDKMGALTYADNKIFNVANSYNLGTVKDLSGDKAQFNANDTYTNVAYNSENGIAAAEGTTGITGYAAAQFKDRTVVDALNANDGVEETVWYQNTENPDLAFNMTVTSDITVPEALNVTLGKTMKLQASITPEDATNKTLVYTSSDDTIASVKEDGTVSGLKLGTADITVKAMDTGKEKTVKVTVKKVEKEPANPTNPAKPSQPTTKTVKKGTKLIVGTNTFVVTNVKAKTVSYKATKNKKAAKITIPATVKSGKQVYKVTTIADNAFKNNKKIKTVVVGKNVRTIGKKAFYGCKNLKKITVQSSIIKKVGAKAFKGINKKAVIKVPSKKYKAYKKVFKGKGQAKTVTIKK